MQVIVRVQVITGCAGHCKSAVCDRGAIYRKVQVITGGASYCFIEGYRL